MQFPGPSLETNGPHLAFVSFYSFSTGKFLDSDRIYTTFVLFCPPFKFINHSIILFYMNFDADIDITWTVNV
jgi:hypothetical protein